MESAYIPPCQTKGGDDFLPNFISAKEITINKVCQKITQMSVIVATQLLLLQQSNLFFATDN